MARRNQVVFTCGQCGHTEARWLGKCPDCGAWNSFTEEVVKTSAGGRGGKAAPPRRSFAGADGGVASVRPLSDISSSADDRFTSGQPELDRVLGGGIVPGSLVLVGGEPGIGKSTLLLQVLDAVGGGGARGGERGSTGADRSVMLVCGEESPAQVKMRAERICAAPGAIDVLAETELETVLEVLEQRRPALVVIDSVQTLYSDELSSAPGSVSQVREATSRFLRLAKETGTAVFLVGHVTKDGAIAGPRVLEHMVDTVLQFEGDRSRFFRVLRAAKNRFGSTNELGVFEMGERGLVAVDDPSSLFLAERGAAGSAVHVAVEGTRCFLVEVQALVNPTDLALPRRLATGFDRNRLAMIVAVLARHCRLSLATADVFVNIVGGVRIEEPAADLAVALAVASAERNVPLPPGAAVFGEIGLTGELRSSGQPERRVTEATKAGFGTVFMSRADARRLQQGAPAEGLDSLRDAIARVLPSPDVQRGRHRDHERAGGG
ncbi:MAG TPA: DNA repair protein RadA [Thermoleophilia bacterium]|nr:DNA repair protein RadA [Thermoleophilia bacterium]